MVELICAVIGHRRDVTRVWDDGYNFRAPCKRCGFPMIKASFGDWRAFDSARDFPPEGTTRGSRPIR